jgi:hypothetical protein
MKAKRNLVWGIVYCVVAISISALACNALAAENDLSVYGDALTIYIENPSKEFVRAASFGSIDYSIYGVYVTECLQASDLTPFFYANIDFKNMSVWGHAINNLIDDN